MDIAESRRTSIFNLRYANAMSEVTRILKQLQIGEQATSGDLLPLVYDELRKLAVAKLSNEKPGQTLQATALVHEAYLRLVGDGNELQWDSKRHFFSAAAEAMRRILIERARQRKTEKRGGGFNRVDVEPDALLTEEKAGELLAVSEALDRLAEIDGVKCDLVKLRYFAGLTVPEAAKVLGIGQSTAEKHWTYAKVWLKAEILGLPPSPES